MNTLKQQIGVRYVAREVKDFPAYEWYDKCEWYDKQVTESYQVSDDDDDDDDNYYRNNDRPIYRHFNRYFLYNLTFLKIEPGLKIYPVNFLRNGV